MLSYAKLPRYFPFPVAVQHGWQRIASSFESSGKPPEIWVWSERIAKDYEKYYPEDRIRVVGSFFLYYLNSIAKETCGARRGGSVCITPHSSHFAKTEYSIDEYIEGLNALGDEYQPITVMVYYLDMSPEIVGAYEKAGFNVVTNGSLFSSDFMSSFMKNVSGKRYCIYGDIGSAVFFCSHLGLDLIPMNIQSSFVNMGNPHLPEYMSPDLKNQQVEFLESLRKEDYSVELGKGNMLSSSEMRALILRNYFSLVFLFAFSKRLVYKLMQSFGLKKRVELQ